VDVEAPDPVQVVIPEIGVAAPVVALALEPSGALAAPASADDAGWWSAGPEPGERGAAVIAGHVDSRRATAVFHRLRELGPGDVVEVVRADGSRVDFVVDHLEQHPKAAFPTGAVYGATAGSTLRLITCGGVFDRSTGHYVDNVIVFADRR
jgi:sortase (surface protein transpeptidase)